MQDLDLLRLELCLVILDYGSLWIGRFLTFGRYLLVAQNRLRLHHHHIGRFDAVDLSGGSTGPATGWDGGSERRGHAAVAMSNLRLTQFPPGCPIRTASDDGPLDELDNNPIPTVGDPTQPSKDRQRPAGTADTPRRPIFDDENHAICDRSCRARRDGYLRADRPPIRRVPARQPHRSRLHRPPRTRAQPCPPVRSSFQWLPRPRGSGRRLGVDPGELEVVSVEEVTWPDGSLGCPEPGMSYTQALVEGSKVVLGHDGRVYVYHAGDDDQPFLCPSDERTAATSSCLPPDSTSETVEGRLETPLHVSQDSGYSVLTSTRVRSNNPSPSL